MRRRRTLGRNIADSEARDSIRQRPDRAGPVPEVWLKLRGSRPGRFGMDTGSTGIVVAAEHFTPGAEDVAEGPGR